MCWSTLQLYVCFCIITITTVQLQFGTCKSGDWITYSTSYRSSSFTELMVLCILLIYCLFFQFRSVIRLLALLSVLISPESHLPLCCKILSNYCKALKPFWNNIRALCSPCQWGPRGAALQAGRGGRLLEQAFKRKIRDYLAVWPEQGSPSAWAHGSPLVAGVLL